MNLLKSDLKLVAKAIDLGIRGKGHVVLEYTKNVPLIHLYGRGYDFYVRGEDWLKILPFFADGTLNPLVTTFPLSIPEGASLNPSDIERTDSSLYNRILGILETLFTKDYPQAKL